MSDLTDRLRRHAEWAAQGYDVLFTEAADRIEELEAGLRTIVREMDRRQDIASKTVGSNVPGDPLAAIAREALDE